MLGGLPLGVEELIIDYTQTGRVMRVILGYWPSFLK